MHSHQSSTLKENRPHGTKSFPFATYQTLSLGKGTLVKHHWHDEIEILYFYGGDYQLKINMENFSISSPCLYFINPGELHSIISEKPKSPGEDAILFHPEILRFDTQDPSQMHLIQPILSHKMSFPRCIMPGNPAFSPILSAFSNIMHTYSPKLEAALSSEGTTPLANQLYIKSSLLWILAVLWENGLFTLTEKNYDRRIEGIKSILTFIQENYKEKIYIHDLSEILNMNEQYFCRFFKKTIGRSPMEYVNEYRIKHAVRLLEETDLPVTEICLECGFNNFGNFIREFRQLQNTTPLQYRIQYLSAHKHLV